MRIPPLYRKPGWQRFFSGVVIGGAIAWIVFLFMYGTIQEEQAKTIKRQGDDIKDLKQEKLIWQEEYKLLNKQTQKQLTVQNIKVKITNYEKYKLDTLSIFELEESVKDDFNMVIAKDLETVFNSREMLRKIIENKVVTLNEKRYRLEVKEIYIYTTLYIQLSIKFDG